MLGAVHDGLGFRFRVSCPDDEAISYVESLLVGLASQYDDGDVVELALAKASANDIGALIGTINLRAVEAAAGALLLHAGSVCRTDGASVLLCGASGAGKSTMTTMLAVRGLGYLTDEAVCIAPDRMRITPFRRPLSVKSGAWPMFPALAPAPGSVAERCSDQQWLVPPHRVEATALPDVPLEPRLLVFPSFKAGQALQIERIAPAEAAYLLGSLSVRLHSVRGGGLEALARLVRRAPAYRVTYGVGELGAVAVEDLLAAA
ncbi:MAG: hypothetical protein QOI82_1567 [Actinomycetota bacterium]|nr:hypothetical protein [Actinomycetota bacterium]